MDRHWYYALVPLGALGGTLGMILYAASAPPPSELEQKAGFCSELQRSTDEDAQREILLQVPITSGEYASRTCQEVLRLYENQEL